LNGFAFDIIPAQKQPLLENIDLNFGFCTELLEIEINMFHFMSWDGITSCCFFICFFHVYVGDWFDKQPTYQPLVQI